jgi:hypothetical protein
LNRQRITNSSNPPALRRVFCFHALRVNS